jgi:predicted esterase
LTSTHQRHYILGRRGGPVCSVWSGAIILLVWFGAGGLPVHHVAAQAWSPVPATLSAAAMRTAVKVTGTRASQRKVDRDGDDLLSALPTVTDWFRPENDGLAAIPAVIEPLKPIAKDQVHSVHQQLWQAYRKSRTGAWLAELLPDPIILHGDDDPRQQPHELKLGDKRMPFYFIAKGDLPKQRPLFIALHGGGSAGGRAPSPHGWAVNTREWNVQARLAARVYPSDALYFVPRMADDNDGRWYFGYCQDAYDRVIRAAILHRHVNPNRVYLIGISEGAYTAYRMGAFMADRWAGAGSMAGGEPLGNAPPENMRNIAFRADIGEKDTLFDRVGLNRRYGQALEKLKKDDPDGFPYQINVQAGRGHGIDYRPCPQWLVQYQRNPWPRRVTWTVIKVDGRRKKQLYWLALDREPPAWPIYIDARIDRKANRVTVTIEKDAADGRRVQTNSVALRVYLNDELLDLDQAVTVVRNGVEVFQDTVQRNVATMMRSLAERGDPCYLFPAVVTLSCPRS